MNKIKNIFLQTWVNLRKVGNGSFINSMYIWIFIVPVLAKLFEHVGDGILEFVIFEQKIYISSVLPFSWKIFYFSALSFAIGNLILRIRCPKIVQDHLSYKSYIDEGKTLKQLSQYSDEIGYDWGKLAKEVEDRNCNLQIAKNEGNGGGHDFESLSSQDPVYYFWPIFEDANHQDSLARFICTLFYGIGFGLFFWVILQNLLFVVQFITK